MDSTLLEAVKGMAQEKSSHLKREKYRKFQISILRNKWKEGEKQGNTCLQSWCCGFPSLFVPSFLQMEGSVILQGLSSHRPSCTSKQHTGRKREHSCSIHTNGGDTTKVHYFDDQGPRTRGQIKGAGEGGRSLTAPQMETQSSGVLRKLLGSNGCQRVKMTGVWSVHWKSICISVSWSPIQSCSTSDRRHTQC